MPSYGLADKTGITAALVRNQSLWGPAKRKKCKVCTDESFTVRCMKRVNFHFPPINGRILTMERLQCIVLFSITLNMTFWVCLLVITYLLLSYWNSLSHRSNVVIINTRQTAIYTFVLSTAQSKELRLDEPDIFVWICHVTRLPKDICKHWPSIFASQSEYLNICILKATQGCAQAVSAFRRLKKDTGPLSTQGKSRLPRVKLGAWAKHRKLTQCPGMSMMSQTSHWVSL